MKLEISKIDRCEMESHLGIYMLHWVGPQQLASLERSFMNRTFTVSPWLIDVIIPVK